MRLGLRRRRQSTVAVLIPRAHLSDFARPGRVAPRNIYVRDPLAEQLAARGGLVHYADPDAPLYDLRGLQ